MKVPNSGEERFGPQPASSSNIGKAMIPEKSRRMEDLVDRFWIIIKFSPLSIYYNHRSLDTKAVPWMFDP
jgi:hypothetical protein